MSNRVNGTVKWFSSQKGYGFVSDENGNDYFTHVSEIPDGKNLDQGDEVSFEPIEGTKGSKATKLEIL